MPVYTFTRTKTTKSGKTIYTTPGIRTSVEMKKSFFTEAGAPQTLTIEADNLVTPGVVKPVVSSEEAIAKAKAAVEKAQARAKAAQTRAEKAVARAAKLVPATEAAPATEEPVQG